ncbi:7783_t:CDS:2 [Racocetra fulgida]|uniref:7783_t:CDS:1 n=1 Tax=Racocetra fulgida TaxID=60492 RepID=A0A9N8VJL9_9GLOM|nr:7783_t:CDS:2 [Racocetra fulgida]
MPRKGSNKKWLKNILNTFKTYILKTNQFYQCQLKRKEISSDEYFNNTDILNALKSRIVKMLFKDFEAVNRILSSNKIRLIQVSASRKHYKSFEEVFSATNNYERIVEIDNNRNAINEHSLPRTYSFIVDDEEDNTSECSNSNHRNNDTKGDDSEEGEENSDNNGEGNSDDEGNSDNKVNNGLEESDGDMDVSW